MRDEDLRRFENPYPAGADLASALELELGPVRSLRDEIFQDLDDQSYGVRWWASLEPWRRILIGDYLYVSVESIETNLVEARLHELEALYAWERTEQYEARRFSLSPSGHPIDRGPVPRTRPLDDILHRLAPLHEAGLVRALGSALDCLGAAIVGVAALPVEIVRVDLLGDRRGVRKCLQRTAQRPDAHRVHRYLHERLEAAIGAAGPPGWLDWLIRVRNMYVHRGRRLVLRELRLLPGLYDPDGRRLVQTQVLPLLPSAPDRTDIEAFAGYLLGGPPPVLTERASTTCRGLIESTVRLVTAVATALLEVWRARRANPDLLPQPREQWQTPARAVPHGFVGYTPGADPYNPTWMQAHEVWLHRLRAAAVHDASRELWSSWIQSPSEQATGEAGG